MVVWGICSYYFIVRSTDGLLRELNKAVQVLILRIDPNLNKTVEVEVRILYSVTYTLTLI